jgi:DNA-binding PadR family transcriptional regulator
MKKPPDGQESLERHLPLTESTFLILLALLEPRHGYAVMQRVEEISEGSVKVGPGTLYGAFSVLEKAGLIRMTAEEERRKTYELTAPGRKVLEEHAARLEQVVSAARRLLGGRRGRGA